MNDLIKRQDAIDAINEYGSVWMEYTDAMTIDEIAERALKASKQSMVKILHDLPSAQPEVLACGEGELKSESQWIPCSERLPKVSEYIGDACKYYLIQDEYGNMQVAHYGRVGWIPIHALKAIGDEVIAWMPLPEPWKESEE